MIAPHPSSAGVTSKTSTHGIGKFATMHTGGSTGTEACSAIQDRDYRHGDFAAGPASGESGLGLATRSHTSGLGYGGVFLLWQGGTWSGSVS